MPNKYPIPIYLNQRILFDIFAMMEDGFANVENVKEVSGATGTRQETGTATFGISNVLSSLLKIDLKADKQTQAQNSSQTEKTYEKVYTPASILSKIVKRMTEDKDLKIIGEALDVRKIDNGDYIDILTSLVPDPVYKVTDQLNQIAGLFSSKAAVFGLQSDDQVVDQMGAISELFNDANMTYIIGTLRNSKYKLVIGVEPNSVLRGVDLGKITGNYRVLGKIANIVSDDSVSIDIGRGTKFDIMKQLMPENALKGDDFPELLSSAETDRKISGPFLQITPVAIYV